MITVWRFFRGSMRKRVKIRFGGGSLLTATLFVSSWSFAGMAVAQPSPGLPPDRVERQAEERLVTEEVEVGALSAEDLAPRVASSPAPIITAVEIRSDSPLDRPAELEDLITVTVGSPLDGGDLRRSLRNIQATGLAYEVEAMLRREDSADGSVVEAPPRGVLVIVIRSAVQLESVDVTGNLGLRISTLRARLAARAGEPLLEDRLIRGVFNLQDLYRERGYFDAVVRLRVAVDDARKRARVTYDVDAGGRAEVGTVDFEGELGGFAPAQLIEQMKAGPGAAYRTQTAKGDAERVRSWLLGQGFRAAGVTPPAETYRSHSHRVDLVFRVSVGPKIEARIVGARRKDLEKRDLLPFLGEDGYDEALVLQAVQRIERYFQERGHHDVRVDWREERPSADRLTVVLTIEPGALQTLESLDFVGNETFDDMHLAEFFETVPKRLLTLGSGRLVEAVLEADLNNLRSFYALEGFVGTKVGPAQLTRDGDDLHLVIPVEEGRRRRLVDLHLEGVVSLDAKSLSDELVLDPGGPFHPLLLEEALAQVVGRYSEAGFAAAQASAVEDWDSEGRLVEVTIQVFEGPRTVVGRVIVRGNLDTQTSVIENALDIEAGQPISRARLLEVERRLYRLGVFSRVDVDLVPAPLGSTTRDLLVNVSEGRTKRLTYGVGYDYDGQVLDGDPYGIGGLLGFSQSNLLGRAYTLQFDLRARTNDQLARLVLDQPTVAGKPISIIYSLTFQREDRETYEVERSIARIEGFRLFGKRRFGLGFDFRQVSSVIAPLMSGSLPSEVFVERADQNIEISSLVPSVSLDHRDDPIDPTTGWSAQARLQYAFPFLDTKADFLKLFGQVTGYYPFDRYGGLAASIRVGAIEPFGDATADLGDGGAKPENLMIPIDERFFAGGNYSHRAFGQDKLGVPGKTILGSDARGGNGVLLVNLDYRFAIGGGLEGVVFVDAGNVWEAWDSIDPGDLRVGAGLGVRYRSPIGPIRAGFAWNLDRTGSEAETRFILALGNPF